MFHAPKPKTNLIVFYLRPESLLARCSRRLVGAAFQVLPQLPRFHVLICLYCLEVEDAQLRGDHDDKRVAELSLGCRPPPNTPPPCGMVGPVLKSAAMRARSSTGFEPGPILRPRHLRSAPPCPSPGRETYCAPAPPAPLSFHDRDPCTILLYCPVAVRLGQIAPYDHAPPLRLDALPSR